MNNLGKTQRIRLIAWLIATVAIALTFCYMLIHSIHLNTNILDMLPKASHNRMMQKASHQFDNTLGKQVIFLIGNPDKAVAEQAADQFYQLITSSKKSPIFSKVTYLVDAKEQQAWSSFYYPYRLSLLAPAQQTLLQAGDVDTIQQQALFHLYSPMSAIGANMLAEDPYFLFQQFMLSLPNPASHMTLSDQRMMTQTNGSWYVLIRGQLQQDSFSTSNQTQAIHLIHTAELSVMKQYPHTQLLKTGMLFYASAGTQEAEKNISTIGLGSILSIILLVLWIFRSPSPLFYILLSSAFGFMAAFVVTQALFGSIFLFTLVIGASLIGISVDYAFFFYADRFFGGPAWQASTGLSNIFSGISLGLFNMILAYLLIFFIPFIAIKQLAIFSMVGLIMAYATVVCLFPAILKPVKKSPTNLLVVLNARYLALWKRMSIRHIVILYTCIIAISLYGLYLLKANDDIHILAAATPKLKYDEVKIDKIIGNHIGVGFYIVDGDTPDATLRHMHTLTAAIDKSFPTIGSPYISISAYLPTITTQQKNYQLQTTLLKQHLPSYLQHIGMSKQQALTIQQQLTQTPFAPLTIEDWLKSTVSGTLHYLWLGKIHQRYISIVLLSNQLPTSTLATITEHMPFVTYVNKAKSVSHAFHVYRIKMMVILILAYLLLSLLLLSRYGLKRGLLLFIPPITTCLLTFGLLGILGIPLTLFSVLAAILVFGIVVDYVIFFAETHRSYHSTMLAVTLSAITTLLSFGLLSFSSTMAIHYFGVTVAIGIISGFLLAPLIVRLSPGVPHEL